VRWGDYIAKTAVRKVVYVLVGFVLAAVMGLFSGKASAQAYGESSYSQCFNTADPEAHLCHTAQDAYAQSKAAMVALLARYGVTGTPFFAGENSTGGTYNLPGHHVTYWAKKPDGSNYNEGIFYAGRDYLDAEKCPAGVTWDDINKVCGSPCDNKPDLGPQSVKGAFTACSGGCQYEQKDAVSVCLGSGAEMYCGAKAWKATGQACSATDKPVDNYDPNKPVCATIGGGSASECVKPNGDHCVVGARGTVMCWAPSETGPRMTSDGKDGADRKVAPDTPVPPPNMKNPVADGTTQTKIGDKTYNTTNFNGSGAGPGQVNVGGGGNDPGTGAGKGGTGAGAGTGDQQGPGAVGAGVSNLYTKTEKTISSVYSDFKTNVSNAPFVNAASGVFGGCSSGGGSCPMESWSASQWGISQDLGSLCSGPLGALLAFAGYVCLAGMAFFAFKVALL
jgi:hypothetical protein